MVEYRCPVCSKPVLPNFTFCKSCGARLSKDLFQKRKTSQARKEMHSSSMSPGSEVDESAEEIVLDQEIVHALSIKGRLIVIDQEMEEILEEIENLEERVKVGLIPKEDAKERVTELNRRFVEIRLDKKKIAKGSAQIPIFELMKKKDDSEDHLLKLEGLKKDKSISQKTYEKMKDEYKATISDSEKHITTEIIKMERWKDQLKKELGEKRELLETLFVRKSTGELSEKEYNEEKEELSEEIKNWEAAYEELKKTLRKLK